MLGFVWLLRSEAARYLRAHVVKGLDVDFTRRFGWEVRMVGSITVQRCERDPSKIPVLAAIELLTRYTARTECKP